MSDDSSSNVASDDDDGLSLLVSSFAQRRPAAAREAPTLSASDAKRANPFDSALHDVTTQSATGLGAKLAGTNDAADDLWLPTSRPWETSSARFCLAPTAESPSPTRVVQLELRRFACLNGLRQLFRDRCAALSLRTLPINALERWRFNCKWQEEEAASIAASNTAEEIAAGDALLPTGPPQRADATFAADLCRAGLQPAQAEQLVAGLRAASVQAATELAQMAAAAAASSSAASNLPSSAPEAALVQKRLPGGVRQLQWGGEDEASGDATAGGGDVCVKPSVRVTEATIEKLRALHARHSSCEADEDPTAAAAATATTATTATAFELRLFAVLLRYEAIGGAGFQAALGGSVFRELQTSLGVNFECFASPLNCYYGAYCSAFPDLDAPFGSRGSFARFSPKRGAYECNPPFVDVIIDACALQMIRLLETAQAAGEPLAFAVVLPGWADSKGYNALLAAPLLRRSLLVAAVDHGYIDGAQHARRRAYRESTYDTMLFLLQTDAHAAGHPIDDSAMKRLETTLAECTPTADGPALPAAATGCGSASEADGIAEATAASSTSKRDAPACLRAKDAQPARKRRRRGGKGGGGGASGARKW